MQNKYSHCYDKQGNLKVINPPIYSTGKVAKAHTKTLTGKLHDSVGFSCVGKKV